MTKEAPYELKLEISGLAYGSGQEDVNGLAIHMLAQVMELLRPQYGGEVMFGEPIVKVTALKRGDTQKLPLTTT